MTREVSVSDILKAKQYELKRPQLKTADQCNRRKVASSLDADVAFNLGLSQEPLKPATNAQSQVSTALNKRVVESTGSYLSEV